MRESIYTYCMDGSHFQYVQFAFAHLELHAFREDLSQCLLSTTTQHRGGGMLDLHCYRPVVLTPSCKLIVLLPYGNRVTEFEDGLHVAVFCLRTTASA
jgi:hypothetical protein